MTQLTFGLQLGGQAFSQMIFFQNEAAFNDFTSGHFEFSAQATAVAITAGVSAEANTGGGVGAAASGRRVGGAAAGAVPAGGCRLGRGGGRVCVAGVVAQGAVTAGAVPRLDPELLSA